MEDIVISSSGFEIANYNVNKTESENNKGKLTLAVLTASIFVFTPTATKQNFYSQPENNYLFEDSLDDVSGEVFYNTSNSYGSITIEEGGETEMTHSDVTKKDLDYQEQVFDLKIDNLNTKVDNLDDTVSELKEMLNAINSKIDDLPSKDYVSSEIKGQTNKYLLWLGAGLVAAIGILQMFLESMLSGAG